MQRPDPERVWLQLFIGAIGGLSSIDKLHEDGVLAREAKGIADAAMRVYEARWSGEHERAMAHGGGSPAVQGR